MLALSAFAGLLLLVGAVEECAKGDSSCATGGDAGDSSLLQRTSKDRASLANNPQFFGPHPGYCKTHNGHGVQNSPKGLGQVIFEGLDEHALYAACERTCLEKDGCKGFAIAPSAHQKCNLFSEAPDYTDTTSDQRWQCYTNVDWNPHLADLYAGTPPANKAEAPSPDAYAKALAGLDVEAVKADMTALLADSKDFWPADYGNYGPFMVRLAWHCSGSYRKSDGAGGCGGGRQRFEPERSWPDNTNLDKARALVAPLKEKYGDALSWGDLFVLAGTTALRDAGAPLKQMCFGRMDDSDGAKSAVLGPTALQAEKMPCAVNGKCKAPLGATTVGLIYVNPEGPMANPDPALSSKDVRQTFETMGHSDRNTVALIGGHALGKVHGACPKGAGNAPDVAYNTTPRGTPWAGLCGTGKGKDTVTSGFEGPWTTNPLKWDNEYYQALLENEWEKHVGPGGHWQWRIKGSDDKRMMLTSDLALLHDAQYLEYVKQFASDMNSFNDAFDDAWFDLTTTYGSGTWSKAAKCDNGAFPEALRSRSLFMINSDVDLTAEQRPTAKTLGA